MLFTFYFDSSSSLLHLALNKSLSYLEQIHFHAYSEIIWFLLQRCNGDLQREGGMGIANQIPAHVLFPLLFMLYFSPFLRIMLNEMSLFTRNIISTNKGTFYVLR